MQILVGVKEPFGKVHGPGMLLRCGEELHLIKVHPQVDECFQTLNHDCVDCHTLWKGLFQHLEQTWQQVLGLSSLCL